MGGNNLADYRRAKGLALFEAARQLGVKASELSSWEHERAIPSANQVKYLAALYGCTISQIEATLPDLGRVEEEAARFERLIGAISAIHQHAKAAGLGRGNGGQGEMPCPVCGERLCYSVAGVNGHIWSACKTDGCVRFIQ